MIACCLAVAIAPFALASPALAQTNAYALLQQQSLKLAGSTSSSLAGTAVAISADGSTAVVGAPGDNSNVGGVLVYVWNSSSGTWIQQGTEMLGSGSSSSSGQGTSVAISGDGNTILIGGPSDGALGEKGAVWVFTRTMGAWSQQGEKLVGSGGSANDNQGTSVALSADGNTALVGGPGGDSNNGLVWVYTRSNGTWSQIGPVTPSDETAPSSFGISVSLSADGKTALIGGDFDNTGVGAAWIYSFNAGALTEGTKLVGTGAIGGSPTQGFSVAISGDGSTAVVGGPGDNSGDGAVWVFTKLGSTWSQAAKLVPTDEAVGGSGLGGAVAVSHDGSVILGGGDEDNKCFGAVWMFARTGLTAWTQQGTKIVPSDATGGNIGSGVSLSADGNSAFLGSTYDNGGYGAAWPFNANVSFVPTGTSSNLTQTILVQMQNSYTLGSIAVVTQGAPHLDFVAGRQAGSGACQVSESFSSGSNTCTYAVQFQPTAAGLRLGAILFYDQSNALRATVFLNGVGLAPQLSFLNRTINTTAGTPQMPGYGGDGDSPTNPNVELNEPTGVTFDGAGNYYIADDGNNVARGVNTSGASTLYAVPVSSGTIQTIAGNGSAGSSGDNGPATSAELNAPQDPVIDGAGNFYIADFANQRVRKIDPVTGTITTYAGGGAGGNGGLANSAALAYTYGVGAAPNGDIFIGETSNGFTDVRRVSAETGIITTFAGTGTPGSSGDGGPATSAELNSAIAFAFDANQDVYISDDDNNIIRKVTYGTSTITTVAGTQRTQMGPGGCEFSGDGGLATAAEICDPEGIVLDAAGDLYITDSGNNAVREVFAGTGIIQTIAGSTARASGFSGDTGAALSALFDYPGYPAIDIFGNLWISDECNAVIRELFGAAPLIFEATDAGATSPQQDVTITNDGTAPMTFSVLASSANFNLGGSDTTCTLAVTLNSGQSCVLGVQFAPTGTGPLDGMITVTSNAGTQQFNVSGTGELTPTTTTLSITPSTAFEGQLITLTATITPAPSGPSYGTVEFDGSSVVLGTTDVLSNGTATLDISVPLGAGMDSVTATYSGNAEFMTSTSSPFIETVNPLTRTTVTLNATPNPVLVGQTLTLTATVSPVPTGTSLGQVVFCNGGGELEVISAGRAALLPRPRTAPLTLLLSQIENGCGSGTVIATAAVNVSGVASTTTSALPAGAYTLTAVYSGNTGFDPSISSSVSETVSATTSTTTTLTVSPNPVSAGQTATFTVTISPLPSGSSPGTVSFYSSTTLLGTVTASTSGATTFTSTTLPGGSLTLTADFSGNATLAASNSSPVSETVNPGFAVTAPQTPQPVAEGGSVAVTVTVPPLGGPFNSPVTMSASGLPAGATAIFNPPVVTPGANGIQTMMTIQLANLAQSAPAGPETTGIATLGLLLALCASRLRQRGRPRLAFAVLLLAIAGAGMGLVGCAGGFGAPSLTPPGSFVVTVTGTSGSLHASTTVTMKVQ